MEKIRDYSYEIDTVIDIPEQELQKASSRPKKSFYYELNFDNITHLKGVYFTIHIESENGNECNTDGIITRKNRWFMVCFERAIKLKICNKYDIKQLLHIPNIIKAAVKIPDSGSFMYSYIIS